jgi:predicted small secreted protein
MKKLLVIVGLLAALSACNTVDGLGQDISAGARAVDDTF